MSFNARHDLFGCRVCESRPLILLCFIKKRRKD
nr:MAG TPA: RNA polymerase L [Caudoviricetes sp.]